MKSLAELLKHYAEENLPNSGNPQNIADRLYWCYMEHSRIDNDKTNACYAALREK